LQAAPFILDLFCDQHIWQSISSTRHTTLDIYLDCVHPSSAWSLVNLAFHFSLYFLVSAS